MFSPVSHTLSYNKGCISTWGNVRAGGRKPELWKECPTWDYTICLPKDLKLTHLKQGPFQDIIWEDLEVLEGRKDEGKRKEDALSSEILKWMFHFKAMKSDSIITVFNSNWFRRKTSAAPSQQFWCCYNENISLWVTMVTNRLTQKITPKYSPTLVSRPITIVMCDIWAGMHQPSQLEVMNGINQRVNKSKHYMTGSKCSHDSYSLEIMYFKNVFLKKKHPKS